MEKRLKLKIINAEEKSRIYSNFVIINHSPADFTLDFCEIYPIYGEEILKKIEESGEIEAISKVRIVMSPPAIKAFLNALKENYENFEKKYQKTEEESYSDE